MSHFVNYSSIDNLQAHFQLKPKAKL